MGEKPAVIAVAGPTASGKSDLGLKLAQRLGGEIVCMDSMQIYRRMDIGTAKPTAQERALLQGAHSGGRHGPVSQGADGRAVAGRHGRG